MENDAKEPTIVKPFGVLVRINTRNHDGSANVTLNAVEGAEPPSGTKLYTESQVAEMLQNQLIKAVLAAAVTKAVEMVAGLPEAVAGHATATLDEKLKANRYATGGIVSRMAPSPRTLQDLINAERRIPLWYECDYPNAGFPKPDSVWIAKTGFGPKVGVVRFSTDYSIQGQTVLIHVINEEGKRATLTLAEFMLSYNEAAE